MDQTLDIPLNSLIVIASVFALACLYLICKTCCCSRSKSRSNDLEQGQSQYQLASRHYAHQCFDEEADLRSEVSPTLSKVTSRSDDVTPWSNEYYRSPKGSLGRSQDGIIASQGIYPSLPAFDDCEVTYYTPRAIKVKNRPSEVILNIDQLEVQTKTAQIHAYKNFKDFINNLESIRVTSRSDDVASRSKEYHQTPEGPLRRSQDGIIASQRIYPKLPAYDECEVTEYTSRPVKVTSRPDDVTSRSDDVYSRSNENHRSPEGSPRRSQEGTKRGDCEVTYNTPRSVKVKNAPSEVILNIDQLEVQTKAARVHAYKNFNDFINDLEIKSVLKVKSVLVEDKTTPPALYDRHVYSAGNLTPTQAETLSECRGGHFKRVSDKNTVFEDPKHFHECLVDFDEFGTHVVLIAIVPVNTYQCQLKNNGKWEAKNLGLRWPVFEMRSRGPHFLSKCLDYNQVDFSCKQTADVPVSLL
jgi:hypothetical protein